jgi:hypothetical protein
MERVKPSRTSERFAAILANLQEVTAGIAPPKYALEAAAQKLLVT